MPHEIFFLDTHTIECPLIAATNRTTQVLYERFLVAMTIEVVKSDACCRVRTDHQVADFHSYPQGI